MDTRYKQNIAILNWSISLQTPVVKRFQRPYFYWPSPYVSDVDYHFEWILH
ncbi:hypothetical protein IV59_GL000026 [Paucilactobacillus hokkaidonensis]|uniref:Uncharacterized protein n=1 Tax=Paucilactobacillus hokkaidonensis TaxID=1193095 RepID=A0ABR5Q842_9LACO|nr:hypothetical protein IV59_GL000026 [Paucilactobacillus hokkaidonensis]